MSQKKITSALISVYYKDGLEPIIRQLHSLGVKLYSTGGTQSFIEKLGIKVTPVESLTAYPSIFGGRVKTLHPKIFGGILYRRGNYSDIEEAGKFEIPSIDLVIVDLYPFEETVAAGGTSEEIIEKIDIGGISLIRAAAKNFHDVTIVASRDLYPDLSALLNEKKGETSEADRKKFAAHAFKISSGYDTAIFNYFNQDYEIPSLRIAEDEATTLRYGENPHQKGVFYGDMAKMFDQLNGKELSYNNLVDIDAAVSLVEEFPKETAFIIIKHTNACGVAVASTVKEAYLKAFEADTVSAFGGVLATNKKIDLETAEELNKLFFEVLIATSYDEAALELLKSKKNRIIMKQKAGIDTTKQAKTILNGVLVQDRDLHTDGKKDLKVVTKAEPTGEQIDALLFASKLAKHTKSNTIVLAKGNQLLASGVGQTSRVDSLNQAIEKAKSFGFDLKGAVMASDAFFPFPDCVEIADKAGIVSVIQPGGSIKDQASIDYCDQHGLSMVFTGYRHFKH
ncbi:MAG: bifunctional phosphoribosylaminoimidazolecarboxamide formyltransferase/IMP cyclohydrolase [Imperialibacter sp.]|uniref:bifunctional phosphoribosylaminoimidazolecarboxamide formyltransferase/IMP cyclohydrolase n=1 Tax=Imperialibacter sp. TaxID=2038411 RepID=UPI0032EF57DD